ncbi:MAG: DNA cytosine methyltransferase [Hyphomicrobiales bacterium]|nr:DNA cytosine methyltransferase [Hyphomicrobiales bacterium]
MPGAFAQSLKVRPAGAVKGCTQAVVSAGLVNMKGSQRSGRSIDEPAPTVCAGTVHAAEVRAFLIKYYGSDQDPRLEEPMHTATTKARFGLVSVHGETYEIVDIGMRMLTPRELFRAQGFPDTYEIVTGQTPDGPIALNKTAQIRMCGNSVCPPMARALVAANFVPGDIGDRPAPAPMDLPLLTAAE